MRAIAANLLPFALLCPALAGAGQPGSRDPTGAVPYDLAFGMASFPFEAPFAVSPDGSAVAYAVEVPPEQGSVGDDRYRPNGTPTTAAGSTIRITDLTSKETVRVCPGGACWRPVWSPDGRSLAFFSDAGGPPQLWVHDLDAGASRPVSEEPLKPKLWTGDEPIWSPDGATLYAGFAPEGEFRSPARTETIREAHPAGVVVVLSGSEAAAFPEAAPPSAPLQAHFDREHLVAVKAVDVRTGATRVAVAQDAAIPGGTIRQSPTGKWLGVLSGFRPVDPASQETVMDFGVVPVEGGEPIPVAKDVRLTAGRYFTATYAWHPTEDRLIYLDDGRMFLLDLTSGTPSAPTPLAPGASEAAPTVFAFTRDGRAAVLGIDLFDDQGYGDPRPRGLAIAPLDGGPPQTILFDDERWVWDRLLLADDRTLWQPDDSSVSVLLTERSTGEKAVVRYDPATGAETVLWKARARIDRLASGGRHDFLLAQYEDLNTPPNLYRFDADFAAPERITQLEPRLESVSTGAAETFETLVPLHDGVLGPVKTSVLLPAGAQRGDRLPGIVVFYPGSDTTRYASRFGGGDVVTVPNLVFTSRGFAVVLVQLTLGPNREAGNPVREMVDVLLPQVYRAAELGYVDPERLGIIGQSYGGYGAGSILTRTNLFRAAVPISGIFDLFGSYGHVDVDGGGFFLAWSEGGQGRMGDHPWSDVRRYLDNSAYYHADKIRTPVLIVHGTADRAYHDAGKLFTALRRLGRPAQLASYVDQGHVISTWRREAATDAARRIVDFFRRHLGDPTAEGRPGPS